LTSGDLSPLERFAEKSADKLTQAIKNAKNVPLDKFLFALGIRYVGEETADLISKNVAGRIQNVRNIREHFPKMTEEEWLSVKGIGEKSAQSLVGWFTDVKNQELLQSLETEGIKIILPEKTDMGTQIFAGKVFVLTGELASFTRDDLKAIIKEKGGGVSSAVSQKTDYVVAGVNPGSKYANAKKLGVKILDEEGFKRLSEI